MAQQRAVCKFAKLENLKAIAWWRMGLGKTRLALGLLAVLLEKNPKRPFVCVIIARPAFEHDLRTELQAIGMQHQFSTERNGWRLSVKHVTIFFCSFANLQKLRPERRTLFKFGKLVIVDELYLFSNPKSQRSRLLSRISEGRACIGLSGTILPTTDNFAIWGQTLGVGISDQIARNATDFRSRYQTTFQAQFGDRSVPLFRPKSGWREAIYRKLGSHIDVLFPDKLNRTVEKDTKIILSDEQAFLIRNLAKNFFLEFESVEKSYKFVTQTNSKIRGILNGWVEAEGKKLLPVQCPKIEYLIDKLRELHECHEQCIIWCAFRNDVRYLASKIPFATLQMVGGSPFNVEAWTSGKSRFVLATMGSGSSVNHFAQVPFAKFFSLSQKPLDHEQSKTRNDRRTMQSGCVHYEYLLGKGSLDEKILSHIRNTKANENDFIKESIKWMRQLLPSDLG